MVHSHLLAGHIMLPTRVLRLAEHIIGNFRD